MTFDISQGAHIIDSRDIISRLEELRELCDSASEGPQGLLFNPEYGEDERAEHEILEAFATACERVSDWEHGACFIHEDHFEDYIAQLIDDCYEIPKQTDWPYRHLTLDIAAAAEEARANYEEYTLDGETYLVRS